MKLPNGPKTPRLIQQLRFIFFPMSFLEDCAKRYGDIFTLKFSYISIVIVSSAKALQKLLNDKEFAAPGDANKVIEPLVGSNSVITISGEKHRRQRQLLMPPFHGDRMRTYGETINNVTQEIIADWEVAKPFNVREAMQKITLRVIMQAVFGLYKGKLARILSDLDLDLVTEAEVKPKRRGVVTGPNRPIQMVVKGKRAVKSRSLETVG